jgi:glycerol-3-phosphate acyltransferase PlsX
MNQARAGVRVAVDAMGGDYAPAAVIEGAFAAHRDLGVRIALVGPEATVAPELKKVAGRAAGEVEIVDAPEVVGMAEKVSRSTLKKRSSIQVSLEMVRDGGADAFFSAGNTAACWTIAKLVLGTLEEVDRPALAAVIPSAGETGQTVLIDVGANAACKARHLEEFAVMGEVYTRAIFHIERPRVGLLSMGEEEGKGDDLTRDVHEVLRGSSLNFIGNVEGSDLFSGKVDVIVTDGFTGNVALKACEALASGLMRRLKAELMKTLVRRLGAALSVQAFRSVRRRVDPAEYGGVPLLGVKGCCVIGHGSSKPLAIRNGIRAAADFFSSGVNARIERELQVLGLKSREASAQA